MAGLTFELLKIFWDIVQTIVEHQKEYDYFFIGMAIYLLMWFVLFRRRFGRLFMIVEHEVIHALFALLTFNRVIEIKANILRGHMMHLSGGNWLLTTAPYFFSLLGVIIIGLIHIASPLYYTVLTGLLGYVVAHHLHTLSVMLSPNQPDIKEVGYPFALLFLPGANLLMLIVLLTQIPYDSIYLTPVIDYLYDLIIYYFEGLKAYIMNWL